MYEVFLFVLVLGCIIMFSNLVFATMQKPSPMQIHICMMLVCVILMFAGYYIELKATTLEMALMGTVVSYIGKPFIMLQSLMVICAFYGVKIRKLYYYIGSFIAALVFLAVFTNPYTSLYYTTCTFDANNLHAPLLVENGPLYWLHAVTMFAYFIGCIVVSIIGYLRNRNSQIARFTVYLVLMVVFVVLGYVVYLAGWSEGYDATAFGALAGEICLSILFYRYRMFDAVSLAKDAALESSITGIIVIDSSKRIAYTNQIGNSILLNGLSLDELLEQTEVERKYYIKECVFNVSRKEIEHNGHYVCTSFEINDITASYEYQALLEKEVKERTEKIESIQRKSIASLASVVEARSLETGQHIVRTSEYSRMIAEALRKNGKYRDLFTDEYIDLFVDVTPLHDVGKISVPDNILLKPGKLDKAEFEEMKKHAAMGAEIIDRALRGVEDDRYVDLAASVALYHHERWDGTGYPRMLRGTEIPIEARIMAVADCFDAMVSDRCYKKAFSVSQSLKILQEESGTHFDPDVVEAFIHAYDEKYGQ